MTKILSFKFPYRSETVLKEGDFVSLGREVAKIVKTTIPRAVDLSYYFNSPEKFEKSIKCNQGDNVTTETVISEIPRLFKKYIFSPIDGIVEAVSSECFTVLIRPNLKKESFSFSFFAKVVYVHNLQIDLEILGDICFGSFAYGSNVSGNLVVYKEGITESMLENSIVAVTNHIFKTDLYYILNSNAKGIIVSSCDAFIFDGIIEEIDKGKSKNRDFAIFIKNGFGFSKQDKEYVEFIKKFEGHNISLISDWKFSIKHLKPALIISKEGLL